MTVVQQFRSLPLTATLSRILAPILSLILSCTQFGCAQKETKTDSSPEPVATAATATPTKAVAQLQAKSNSKVKGTVHFEDVGDNKLRVTYDIEGLPPKTKHGFHIHEKGDCSSADASSAGGHFNPEGHKHGSPTYPERHAGDFGNIKSDQKGRSHGVIEVDDVTVAGTNPVKGLSIIVHKKKDDYKTQPTGGAGDRIACGAIVVQDGALSWSEF